MGERSSINSLTTVRPYKIDRPLGGKKREKGLQGPPSTAHHPKTVPAAVAAAGAAVAAVSRTAVRRIVEPRTAPQRRKIIIPIFYPGTAIRRRTIIVIMPSIGAPFPDIAVHIVQSKSVWGKLSHGSRLLSIFSLRFPGVGIAGIVVSQCPGNGFPKVELGGGSSTTILLPFCLTR